MVRWSNGVAIRSDQTKLLFDPQDSDPTISDLFISHAHFDHSKGFQFPIQKKYSTKETRELYETETGHAVGNWEPIRLGRRVRVGSVEVEAHDAGHVLGSVQYEIVTQNENLVYASHLNFTDALISKAAEVAPCDILILEAAYPPASLALPPRDSVIAEMVKWALECISERRIPTFATDPIGTAQELVRAFNTWTGLSVLVHPKVARINQIYRDNGVSLEYADVGTEQAQALVEEGKCVVIIPRRFDVAQYAEFRVAYVTCWPTQAERSAANVFPLSDQADLDQLLMFVKETRPKTLFTFRGGSQVLAELVSKRLGIMGRALAADTVRPIPTPPLLDDKSIGICEDYILGLVQVPSLTYEKRELIARSISEGFKLPIVQEALNRLTKRNALRYSEMTDGYSLP